MRKRLVVLLAFLMASAMVLVFVGWTAAASGANSPADSAALAIPNPMPAQANKPNAIASQTTNIEFGGLLGFHYSPADVRIAPGDTVKWQGDFTMHPLVSDEGLWTTNLTYTGTEFTHTFNIPGVYHFHCFYHGVIGMKGTVTVGFFDYMPIVDRSTAP